MNLMNLSQSPPRAQNEARLRRHKEVEEDKKSEIIEEALEEIDRRRAENRARVRRWRPTCRAAIV